MLYEDHSVALTRPKIRDCLGVACPRANVRYRSPHCLRHTFSSHLVMHGAPARAIQELAGLSHLETTQRYMPLTQAALEGPSRLLEQPSPLFGASDPARGDGVTTWISIQMISRT